MGRAPQFRFDPILGSDRSSILGSDRSSILDPLQAWNDIDRVLGCRASVTLPITTCRLNTYAPAGAHAHAYDHGYAHGHGHSQRRRAHKEAEGIQFDVLNKLSESTKIELIELDHPIY